MKAVQAKTARQIERYPPLEDDENQSFGENIFDSNFEFTGIPIESIQPDNYPLVIEEYRKNKIIPNFTPISTTNLLQYLNNKAIVNAVMEIFYIYFEIGLIPFTSFLDGIISTKRINIYTLKLINSQLISNINAQRLFENIIFQTIQNCICPNNKISSYAFIIIRKIIIYGFYMNNSIIEKTLAFLANSIKYIDDAIDMLIELVRKQKETAKTLLYNEIFHNLVQGALNDQYPPNILDLLAAVLSSPTINYTNDKEIILNYGILQKFIEPDINSMIFEELLFCIEGLCMHDIEIRNELVSTNYISRVLQAAKEDLGIHIRKSIINILSNVCQNNNYDIISFLVQNGVLDAFALILPSLNHRTLYNCLVALSNILQIAEENQNEEIYDAFINNAELVSSISEISQNVDTENSESAKLSTEIANLILTKIENV